MARRAKPAEESAGEAWLLTFADMISLLTAFFIILWALAITDPVKFSKLAVELRTTFNVGAMAGQTASGVIIGDGGRVGRMEFSDFQVVSENIADSIDSEGLQDLVSVGQQDDGFVITVSGSLLYASGSTTLLPQGADVLMDIGNLLRNTKTVIHVEGHTDNIAIESDRFPTNWELSAERAVTVVRFLSDAVGIDPSRLRAVGHSKYRPLAENDTRENRAKNRRIEIMVRPEGRRAPVASGGRLSNERASPATSSDEDDPGN